MQVHLFTLRWAIVGADSVSQEEAIPDALAGHDIIAQVLWNGWLCDLRVTQPRLVGQEWNGKDGCVRHCDPGADQA